MKLFHIRTLLCAAVLVFGVMVARPTSALAQDETTSSVDDQLKNLTAKLDLTDNQREQIKPILADEQQQLQQKDNSLSREDRLSRLRRVKVASSAKIREVLDDDQKVKFDQMEENRRRQDNKEPLQK